MKLKILAIVILLVALFSLFYFREVVLSFLSAEIFFTSIEIFLFFFGYLVLSFLVDIFTKEKMNYSDREAFKNLLKLLFALILLFYILFKVRIEGLGVVGGTILGLVLGLAAQHTLGNLFAGILIISTKILRPGDKISILSTSVPTFVLAFPPYKFYSYDYYLPYKGYVKEVGLFFSRIVTEDGLVLKVPNLAFLSGAIVNLTESKSEYLKIRVRVEIPIFAEIEKIIEKIKEELIKYTSSRFIVENIYITEINWPAADKANYVVIVECKVKGFDEEYTKGLILKVIGKILRKELKKIYKS